MEDQLPPEPYDHQRVTSEFLLDHPEVLVQSSPGTGKTRSVIDAVVAAGGKALVLAPLSILAPSWGDDIDTFQPGTSWVIAHGKHRVEALQADVQFVITNHDAVKWLAKDAKTVRNAGFTHFIIDESTAFKHRTSQRSKASRVIAKDIPNRTMMSGTMIPNGILDIWHQAFLADGGARLGKQFWKFRDQVCTPNSNGYGIPGVTSVEKPGAVELIADVLRDITIRYTLEDCIDMPPHTTSIVTIEPSKQVMAAYNMLLKKSALEVKEGTINAVHAAALHMKLAQLLSGAVYSEDGKILKVHGERYDLTMELANEREQCLIAFNWKHEKEALVARAEKAGLPYAVIDGTKSANKRAEAVAKFQDGKLKFIFAHPQAASHGLTLTKGTTTIWQSPTTNAEHFLQFNQRIYRAGQTRRTETICIAAKGTLEERIYAESLKEKVDRQELFSAYFEGLI